MASNTYVRKCAGCGGTLKMNGTTSAGTRRWRCTGRGASTTLARPSRAKAWWAKSWLAWLLGMASMRELGVSMRTFQRHTAPFWASSPGPVFDGVVHDVLVIDATRIGGAMCHIIAEPPRKRGRGRRRERRRWWQGMGRRRIGGLLGRPDGPHPAPRRSWSPTPSPASSRPPRNGGPRPGSRSAPFMPRATCTPRPARTPTSSPWPPHATWPP